MFKKIFKTDKKQDSEYKNIMIAALLIHAAKMDENYTDIERGIISRALSDFTHLPKNKIDEIIKLAEEKEKDSNQLIEFTKEIKKKDMDFRLKIIELLWKIIYSDGVADHYETSLIRRVCGLLYVSGVDSGIVKLKVQKEFK